MYLENKNQIKLKSRLNMTSKNTNYLLMIILFIVAVYSLFLKNYFNAAGFFLLGISLFLIDYLSKIGASKKYYIMATILPIIALICFVLQIFH